jgi:hypothetical protein
MIAYRIRELGWKETISYWATYRWVYTEALEPIPNFPRGQWLRQKRGHSR